MRGYAQDCSNPVNLVLMGRPGAGTGTQSARVAHARGMPTIATGDMLRRTAGSATSMGRAVDGTVSPERVAAQIELAIDTTRENVSA